MLLDGWYLDEFQMRLEEDIMNVECEVIYRLGQLKIRWDYISQVKKSDLEK